MRTGDGKHRPKGTNVNTNHALVRGKGGSCDNNKHVNSTSTGKNIGFCSKINIVVIESSDEEQEVIKISPSSSSLPAQTTQTKKMTSGTKDHSTTDTNNIPSRKKRCMGVFHPKFMLLFERSGSIVVLISTSILTRPQDVDGTWLQRFYPNDLGAIDHHESATKKNKQN